MITFRWGERVEIVHLMIWLIYPYGVIAILAMGLLWQNDPIKGSPPDGSETMRFSKSIKITLRCLIFLCVFSGVAIIFIYGMSNEPKQLLNWVISLVTLQPNTDIILSISLLSQIHVVLLFTFVLVLSFTSHVKYIIKPHLFVRNLRMKMKQCTREESA